MKAWLSHIVKRKIKNFATDRFLNFLP